MRRVAPPAAAALTGAALAGALAAGAAPARAQESPAAGADTVLLPPDTAGAGLLREAGARRRRVVVRDPGPGDAGRIVRDVVARPHLVVVAPDTGLTLGRHVRADLPLLIVGGPVRLAATVRGDVVVLGDLYLRPGADVDGRAVAVGGAAYNSTLARVRDGLFAYREVVVVTGAAGADVIYVDARAAGRPAAPRLSLPGTFGLRLPGYDRVNGLSLAFGPELALDTGRVRLEAVATYRSQLGVVDPAVRGIAELTRRTVVELRAERGTLTNDAWARGELVNTIVFAGTGADARNYYRADRADLTVARRYATRAGTVEPLVGVLAERSWSAARDSATSRPFTALGRDDAVQGARRPNPAVTGGRIISALLGARVRREEAGATARAEARVEQALDVERADRFTRAVLDVSATRGARDERQISVFAHAALTIGGRVPTQRYAYLGGGPTLPTLFLLSQGGTELVWGEARYTVPLRGIRLPVAGPPRVTFRAMAGAAGVGTLPALTPNVGLRISAGGLRADAVFDPTGRTRGPQFSVGVGLR